MIDIFSCQLSKLKYNISEKPLDCYKIFRVDNGNFYGPFSNYCFGKLDKNTIIVPEYKSNIKYFKHFKLFNFGLSFIGKLNFLFWIMGDIKYNFDNNYWKICRGYLHSFYSCPCDIEQCVRNNFYGDRKNQYYELWECEIPKETLYFMSDVKDSNFEFNKTLASKSLILKRKLYDFIV